jgi:hypothetical protein
MKIQYGYEKDLTVKTIASYFSVTEEMRLTGDDSAIKGIVMKLGELCPATKEQDMTHRFTFAYAKQYTRDGDTSPTDTSTADGHSFAFNAHNTKGSPKTYSNIVPGNAAFSKASFESAIQLSVENTIDNLGNKMSSDGYNTLLLTDDQPSINRARELAFATADVSTNNSGTFNVAKGMYDIITNPRLATDVTGSVDTTKRGMWVLINKKLLSNYVAQLKAPTIDSPTGQNNGVDLLSGNWTWVASAIYGLCIVSARGAIFSLGDGSANNGTA